MKHKRKKQLHLLFQVYLPLGRGIVLLIHCKIWFLRERSPTRYPLKGGSRIQMDEETLIPICTPTGSRGVSQFGRKVDKSSRFSVAGVREASWLALAADLGFAVGDFSS